MKTNPLQEVSLFGLSGLGVRLLLILALTSGCASLRPPLPQLSPSDLQAVLNRLEAQRHHVTSFYSVGTVTLKKWIAESEEAAILVVGDREPLRIKVEITHPWGAPMLHVLVDRGRFEAFSFSDKTLYTGPATPEVLSRFLPTPPDLDHLWALLRGYPGLPEVESARSQAGPRLICRGVWSLKLHAETLEPQRLAFPRRDLEVAFDDIQATDGILYAGVVRYLPRDRGGQVVIRNKRMVFNQETPEKIYTVKTPGSYRVMEWKEDEGFTPR